MAGSGRIPSDVLDEIKRRVDIASIVGEHVQLKRAGASFKGLCPFHEEKTPSFNVSPAKHIFHCFGCGVGGDVFSFLTRVTGASFPEVVEEMASVAGVDISPYRYQRDGEQGPARATLYDATRKAAEFFQKALRRSSVAQGYLSERALDADTQTAFGIGYAPDGWSNLLDVLGAAGFEPADLASIGLLKTRREGAGYYDAFRHRIMFPIRDDKGRVIAFGGRRIGEGEGPKYINSSESTIYSKGQHLYNLDRATQALRADPARVPVLCEGYMDAIAFHRAGAPQAVANLGTALTASQASRMARLSKKWVLAFDADDAGRRAAVRAVQLLDPLGVDIRVLDLGGKDPDEVLQKQGDAALIRAIDEARTIDQYLFEAIAKQYDLDGHQGRSEAFRAMRELYGNLTNQILKEALVVYTSDRLELSGALVRQAFQPTQDGARAMSEVVDRKRVRKVPKAVAAERRILREALHDALLWFDGPAGALTPDRARDPYVKQTLLFLDQIGPHEGEVFEEILGRIEDENLSRFVRSLAFGDEPVGGPEATLRIEWWFHDLEVHDAKERSSTLRREMLECQDKARRTEIQREYLEVQKELQELTRSRGGPAGAAGGGSA